MKYSAEPMASQGLKATLRTPSLAYIALGRFKTRSSGSTVRCDDFYPAGARQGWENRNRRISCTVRVCTAPGFRKSPRAASALDHLAPAQVASEMRDALLLKRFSVILPSPEEATPQFGVRIDGDVRRLVDDEERQSPGCDLRIVGIGDARRTDDLAQRTWRIGNRERVFRARACRQLIPAAGVVSGIEVHEIGNALWIGTGKVGHFGPAAEKPTSVAFSIAIRSRNARISPASVGGSSLRLVRPIAPGRGE